MTGSIYNHVRKLKSGCGKTLGYRVVLGKNYHSDRYNKMVSITVDDPYYDGATFAKDINSFAWLFHDVLKRDKKWADQTACSNTQASFVIHDILMQDKRWFRAKAWFLATLAFGYIKD